MERLDLPAPLTPSDCDLRDFPFMPLDVGRLRDSDLALEESAQACWAAVLLWSAAWHQIPCGSLPDSDKAFAKFTNLALDEWAMVKQGALRGFIKCSDGRLYHEVVSEKARESWHGKLKYAFDKLIDRLRKANKTRHDKGQPEIPYPTFDAWMSSGRPMDIDLASVIVPQKKAGKKKELQKTSGGIPSNSALKGQGEGEGEGQGEGEGEKDFSKSNMSASPPAAPNADLSPIEGIFTYWQQKMESPRSVLDEKRRKLIKKALDIGYSPADLCRAIRGCSITPHNMGQNGTQTKYNSIELILRDADHIDRFITNDATAPRAAQVAMTPQERMLQQNEARLRDFVGDTPGDVLHQLSDPMTIDMQPST